jgi:hypothetical protein
VITLRGCSFTWCSLTFCVKALDRNDFLVSTMTRAAEPVRAYFERREPRCRICRDETLRISVNELLDWRGVPVFLEGGKTHRITYTDILEKLEPLNEGRDGGDRITYSSLWVHAKRHYDIAAVAAYWRTQMVKEFRNALGGVRTIEEL